MELIFVLVLLIVLIFIGFGLRFVLESKLSADEKAFVDYVHQEAKKLNVTNEKLHDFLIENRERLMMTYYIKHNSEALSDVPYLFETIESTY